jgi:hypothetical protein
LIGAPPPTVNRAEPGFCLEARALKPFIFSFFSDVRALFKKVTTRLLATYSLTPG